MRIVNRWFSFRGQNASATKRLFCLPPAGGGASLFRAWTQLLPDHFDVCPIQLPGREGRIAEKLIAQMQPLVEAAASAMVPLLDIPFAIFGHSMGGLVGLELTRQLRQAGHKEPIHLFVSATRAPHHPASDSIHQLGEEAFVAKLREMGGFSEEVLSSRELMDLVLPVMRADATLIETYKYAEGAPLACPITAFIGADDTRVEAQAIRDWRPYTRGPFREIVVPGGHDFLMTQAARITHAIAGVIGL